MLESRLLYYDITPTNYNANSANLAKSANTTQGRIWLDPNKNIFSGF